MIFFFFFVVCHCICFEKELSKLVLNLFGVIHMPASCPTKKSSKHGDKINPIERNFSVMGDNLNSAFGKLELP